MRPRYITLLAAAVATLVAITVGARPNLSPVQARVAVREARATSRAVPPTPIAVRSLSDAIAFMNARDPEFRAHSGLTRAAIAQTRTIYTFGSGLPNFARDLSAYRTPLANGGFCISFANATSCTDRPPTHAEPVIGLGIDIDVERAGEPFVLVGIKAPDVTSVTYSCGGQTYPATITGDTVTFVAPSNALRADDCVTNASLRSGEVVSVGV